MTAEEHNRYLGIAHITYAGIHAVLMLVGALFALFVFASINNPPGSGGPPVTLVLLFIAVVTLFLLLLTVPSFVAGYGLLKRRSWARMAGLIAGILAATNMPLGTAVCVYSVWFLLGEGGKELYAKSSPRGVANRREALRGAGGAADWAGTGVRGSSSNGRRPEYVPPREPPNWRD